MGECFSSDSSSAERWVTFKFYTRVPASPCFEYYKPIHSNFFQMKSIVFNGFERYVYNRFRTLYGKQGNDGNSQLSGTLSFNPNHSAGVSNGGAVTQFNGYMRHENQQSSIHSFASLQTTSTIGGNNNSNNLAANSVNSRKIKQNYQNLKDMFINAKKNDTFIDNFIQIEYKKLKLRNQYDIPVLIESSQQWTQLHRQSDLLFYIKIKCKKLEKYNSKGAFVLAQIINDIDYLEKCQKSRFEDDSLEDEKKDEFDQEYGNDDKLMNKNGKNGEKKNSNNNKNIKYRNNNKNKSNFIEQGNMASDDEFDNEYDNYDKEKNNENNENEDAVMPLSRVHVSITPANASSAQQREKLLNSNKSNKHQQQKQEAQQAQPNGSNGSAPLKLKNESSAQI